MRLVIIFTGLCLMGTRNRQEVRACPQFRWMFRY